MNKPFLKWAGGKSALVPTILSLIPKEHSGRFIEPFVGGGAVALNVGFERLMLNDTNPGVVSMWKGLRFQSDAFIRLCAEQFTPENNTAESFYIIRKIFNAGPKTTWGYAANFLYLNRHCFNGLCRFNSKGEFNVPYGKYAKPYFPREELEKAQAVIHKANTEIYDYDFVDVMNMATEGDVVYCDPPYIPLSATSNFVGYSKDGFTIEQQWSLAARAQRLRDRGVTVILSNNDVPLARQMYDKADEIHSVQVAKRISCRGDGRKKSGEILAVYRP